MTVTGSRQLKAKDAYYFRSSGWVVGNSMANLHDNSDAAPSRCALVYATTAVNVVSIGPVFVLADECVIRHFDGELRASINADFSGQCCAARRSFFRLDSCAASEPPPSLFQIVRFNQTDAGAPALSSDNCGVRAGR